VQNVTVQSLCDSEKQEVKCPVRGGRSHLWGNAMIDIFRVVKISELSFVQQYIVSET
jgi:hypothetical protein